VGLRLVGALPPECKSNDDVLRFASLFTQEEKGRRRVLRSAMPNRQKTSPARQGQEGRGELIMTERSDGKDRKMRDAKRV
jgi:hypothetical protein